MTSPNWLCRVSGLLVLGILVAASTPVLQKNGSALAQEETPATILPESVVKTHVRFDFLLI